MRVPAFVSSAPWRRALEGSRSAIIACPRHSIKRRIPGSRREVRVVRQNTPRACRAMDESNKVLRGQTLVVTTPLFYVNATPHMGSAYPTIAADALCRFYRLAGAKPILITGCDEHGEKIAAAATAATQSEASADPQSVAEVQAFVDDIASRFKNLWDQLGIQYDRFVRTTDSHHAEIVRQFMARVWTNGDIYKDTYEGLYCTGCEEYKVESELTEGNICPTHLKVCEKRTEENYFFSLSKYQERLESLLNKDAGFVVPGERLNEVLGWVKQGVRDFSVSRANNPWGIPVPHDKAQTIYVWFDALVGYISGLLDNGSDLATAPSKGWPAHVHIIGKDILRFHAVYWPAMLMSAGLPLPRRIVGHGFITKDGLKMGKSLNNTLDPNALVSAYGSDAVRYFFLRAVDFGRDGDFSEQRFVDIVNADLANSLGNLVSRSLNLVRKNCTDGLPALLSGDADSNDPASSEAAAIREIAQQAAVDAYARYDAMDFVGACNAVMEISYRANGYIDRVAPWTKLKSNDTDDIASARICLSTVLEACRIVAVGLSPVTPILSRRIYAALGIEQLWVDGLDWDEAMSWGGLTAGMSFAKPKPVFPRLEIEQKDAVVV